MIVREGYIFIYSWNINIIYLFFVFKTYLFVHVSFPKRKITYYEKFSREPLSKPYPDKETKSTCIDKNSKNILISSTPDDKQFQKGWPSFETTVGLLFLFSVQSSSLNFLSSLNFDIGFCFAYTLSEFYLLICLFDCLSFERSQCRNLGGNWLTTVCLFNLQPNCYQAQPTILLLMGRRWFGL